MSKTLLSDLDTLKLIDPNPGRCEFFHMVMTRLSEQQFSALVFGRKIENAGGYFRTDKLVTRIVLPEDVAIYDENNHTVHFVDDKQFGVFVHEACHFLHLVVDKGRFVAKPLRALPPSKFAEASNTKDAHKKQKIINEGRRNDEYEAGWRSLLYESQYKMDLHDMCMELNTKNMGNYLDKSQEFIDIEKTLQDKFHNTAVKLNTALKGCPDEAAQQAEYDKANEWLSDKYYPKVERINEIIANTLETWLKSITKFSQLSDYKMNCQISAADKAEIDTLIGEMV